MKNAVIYIHGMGGSAAEAEHYKALFPGYDVIGFDYKSDTPWDAEKEFERYFESAADKYESLTLIANSIGAYFSMTAGIGRYIDRAFFISPVIDMEKLITEMLLNSGYTEDELRDKGILYTGGGEVISLEYLNYARANPVKWESPLYILFGSRDNLTSFETVSDFALKNNASLTVMEGGEHWFHTERQMEFLDSWIIKCKDIPED